MTFCFEIPVWIWWYLLATSALFVAILFLVGLFLVESKDGVSSSSPFFEVLYDLRLGEVFTIYLCCLFLPITIIVLLVSAWRL